MKIMEEIKIKIYNDIKESIGGNYGFFEIGWDFGYTQCQEDIRKDWQKYTISEKADFIESLNKQD